MTNIWKPTVKLLTCLEVLIALGTVYQFSLLALSFVFSFISFPFSFSSNPFSFPFSAITLPFSRISSDFSDDVTVSPWRHSSHEHPYWVCPLSCEDRKVENHQGLWKNWRNDAPAVPIFSLQGGLSYCPFDPPSKPMFIRAMFFKYL